jgi:hypothetical protein
MPSLMIMCMMQRLSRKLMKSVKERIRRIFADKGYDSKAKYNTFGENAITPPRKNASSRSRRSPSRAKIVRQIHRAGENEWKQSVDHGKRWSVEIYFLALKRTMGRGDKGSRA